MKRCSAFILSLALTWVMACADTEPSAPESRTSQTRVSLQTERQRLASQQRVTPTVAVPLATAAEMVAALDLPAGMVTAAELKSPHPEAALVFKKYGIIEPRKGDSLVVLSTGRINSAFLPEPGTDFDPPGADNDAVTLKLTIQVPVGANRMSFDYNFLSAESPEFIKTEFNDLFSARVTDARGARTVFSASVNSSDFADASESSAKGTGYDLLFADDPAGADRFPGDYPVGTRLFPDAGVTEFKRVNVDVAAGGLLTLEFDIRDFGDGLLDSSVVIDNITFSVVEAVNPNPSLLDPIFGTVVPNDTRLVTEGGRVTGVAADGASQLLLRVNVPSAGEVLFTVPGGNVDVYGGVGPVGSASRNDAAWKSSIKVPVKMVSGQYFAFAVYRAPKNFNNAVEGAGGVGDFKGDHTAARSRPVSITAAYAPTTGAGFEGRVELTVYRPPVVVVHNIWSSCLYWEGSALIYGPTADGKGLLDVTCADYAASNSLGLGTDENFKVVSDAVYSALSRMRAREVAVSRVDVLAHGAGGLMARHFTELDGYSNLDNFKRGSLNRLITLDTPHLGTRIATEVGVMRDDLMQNRWSTWESTRTSLADLGVFIDGDHPAIDDLALGSGYIQSLKRTQVPSHVMVGAGGEGLEYNDAYPMLSPDMAQLYLKMQTLHPNKPKLPRGPYWDLILGPRSMFFGADRHDLFVPEVSQRGGLGGLTVSEFGVFAEDKNTEHFKVPAEARRHARFLELLNSPVEGRSFATSIPAPPAMARVQEGPPRSPRAVGPVLGPQQLPKVGLRIVSPRPGTRVSPGGVVTVVVEAANGFRPVEVSITGAKHAIFLDRPPFQGAFSIPAQAIGTMQLRAFGSDEEGQLRESEPVALTVSSTAKLNTLSVLNGDAFLSGKGATQRLTVLGHFSDGVRRDLSASSLGTVYSSSDLDVVTVTPEGQVSATGPGRATITLRNGTVFTSITATVGSGNGGGGGGGGGGGDDDGDPCIRLRLGDSNLFVLEDFVQGHYVEGRVAAGGDIALTDFSVGSKLSDTETANTLVAGGDIALSRGGVWGDVRHGGRFSADASVGIFRGTVAQGTPIDFAARGVALRTLSSQLAALPANGSVSVEPWGGVLLRGTSPDVNVFELQGGVIPGNTLLSVEAPAGSLAVINVRGTSVTFDHLGQDLAGGIDGHGVLFNFPDATSLSASSYSFEGTVLAPRAHVSYKDGVWAGGLYARSLTGDNASGHLNPLHDRDICQ